MNITRVTIAGSGVLGSQIAFQTALHGFSVSVYDINDAALDTARKRFEVLQARYLEDNYATEEELNAATARISLHTDLAASVEQADLVIEAIPELLQLKQSFYEELSRVARAETIFASNSSTFIPSQLVDHTDRPEKYLHLHFANDIWRLNVAEIMKHPGTSPDVFDQMIEFAKAIAMVPIPIHKEQPGYVLNALLVPFLRAALELVVNGVADPETVDKTWMISSSAPLGPFGFLDMIGPNTPYNLNKAYAEAGDEDAARIADWIKREYLDKGKMGKQNGQGIYTYPNPAFADPSFLR